MSATPPAALTIAAYAAPNASGISACSLTPASSSSLSSCSLSTDAILEELTTIVRHEKALQARRQELLDALDQLVETGAVEEQLTWNDCKISRRSRKSYTYPADILEQRAALKEAEHTAIALGEATVKVTHFWEVRGA